MIKMVFSNNLNWKFDHKINKSYLKYITEKNVNIGNKLIHSQ